MTPLTCAEAAGLIDLHLADACQPGEEAALSAHVKTCPACATALDEGRDVVALLDWQAREPAARARLHDRLADEASPRRGRAWQAPTFARRLASLAALVLVVFGLTLFLGLDGTPRLVLTPSESFTRDMLEMKAMHAQVPAHPEIVRGPVAAADVPFDVRNTSDSAVTLHVQGEKTRIEVTASGPGQLRQPPTLGPAEVSLAAGAMARLTLRLSVTQPGDYQLRGRLGIEAVYGDDRSGTLWLTVPGTWVRVPGE
jgi:hypothetical protein